MLTVDMGDCLAGEGVPDGERIVEIRAAHDVLAVLREVAAGHHTVMVTCPLQAQLTELYTHASRPPPSPV